MNTRVSVPADRLVLPRMNLQGALNAKPYFRRKDKVVFVVGPTGTGKSRLAIDLAIRFQTEVLNCDKMQVYQGLDIVTNKVTEEECRRVPHHLLGIIDPNVNFTSDDFRNHASLVLESIVTRDRLPIIAGGSNSFIEALVNDDPEFQLRYEFFFLWVDVFLPVLCSFVSKRVDRMVQMGLVDEVRNMFDPKNNDYSQGIRRAIGVPELDEYLRNEGICDAKTSAKLLDAAIAKIKENTCVLARRQLQKIHRLHTQWNWNMHRIDATDVFLRKGEDADESWEKHVLGPSTMVVHQFLYEKDHVATIIPETVVLTAATATNSAPIPVPAVVTATR